MADDPSSTGIESGSIRKPMPEPLRYAVYLARVAAGRTASTKRGISVTGERGF
jgi:hypothetical protein